jgi:hypothetical protein
MSLPFNHISSQLDLQECRFGRASTNNTKAGEGWGDTDFDVDMLAEYLLDDEDEGQGVTFDFK